MSPLLPVLPDELIEKSRSKVLDLNAIHSYSKSVQQKAVELVLVGNLLSTGALSALRAFFVRKISMRSHISMAKLGRDTFGCAEPLLTLSTNLPWLCHHHLVVIGKALLKSAGAYTMPSLHSEFQDQTEVSQNQMQMLWSLFNQIQLNIRNNCSDNNYRLAEIGNYLTEMWGTDYEETLTQLNSQESNNV